MPSAASAATSSGAAGSIAGAADMLASVSVTERVALAMHRRESSGGRGGFSLRIGESTESPPAGEKDGSSESPRASASSSSTASSSTASSSTASSSDESRTVPSYAVVRGVLADRVVPVPFGSSRRACVDSCTISRKCVSSSLSSELQALDVSSALSTFAMAADAREHRLLERARSGRRACPDDDPASGTAHGHADRPRREPRTRSASSPEHGLKTKRLGIFTMRRRCRLPGVFYFTPRLDPSHAQ